MAAMGPQSAAILASQLRRRDRVPETVQSRSGHAERDSTPVARRQGNKVAPCRVLYGVDWVMEGPALDDLVSARAGDREAVARLLEPLLDPAYRLALAILSGSS